MKEVSNQIGEISIQNWKRISAKSTPISKCTFLRKFQRYEEKDVKDFATNDSSSHEVSQAFAQIW